MTVQATPLGSSAVPGISALFIGPNDMTTNMGIPNEYDNPEFLAVIKRIIDIKI